MRLRTLLIATILLAAAAPLSVADVTTSSTTLQPTSGKTPIPDAAAIRSATKLVDDVYKNDFAAARTPDLKLALAQRMLDEARAEKNPAALYAVFIRTLELACDAGDLQSANVVIQSLDRMFEIDALKLSADSAARTAKNTTSLEQQKAFVASANPLVDSALDADRYDLAKSLVASILDTARATKDAQLVGDATARNRQILAAENSYNESKTAQQILSTNPNDPDANLKLGSFRCFIKGDWEHGLPLLARSSDESLKSLAKTEIAGITTVDDQVKLADGWWDLADKNSGTQKKQLLAHAVQWYQAALPSLSGLTKMRIEKRLTPVETVDRPVEKVVARERRPIDLLTPVNIAKDSTDGKWDLKNGELTSSPTDHCTLQFPYHPPAEYDFHMEFSRDIGADQVVIILVAGGKQFTWSMGGWDNSILGFERVAGKRADNNKTSSHLRPAIENGKRYDVLVKVRKNGVEAFVNHNLVSQYKTDYSDMALYPGWKITDQLALGVGTHNSKANFYKIEVTEAGGSDLPISTEVNGANSTHPPLVASTDTTPLPGTASTPRTLKPYTSPPVPSAPTIPSEPPQVKQASPAPVDPNAIERPEFAHVVKPVTKNITSITSMMLHVSNDGDTLGLTTDIIAAVPQEARRSRDGGAGFIRSRVNEEMNTSFEEAIRAVKLRYPTWDSHIDVSFGEKYSEHDGGSAGTAFGVLLLSSLEGFDIDPKCAITGDITVDWKVRKVAGVASKIHGAILDKCLYAAIPTDNQEVVNDLALLYGEHALWDIQILSIPTLQQAAAVVRQDRAPQLAEALKLFATLQPELAKSNRVFLKNPDTIATLKRIVELAPNHLSAKALLAIADNTAPKTLSNSASLYRLSIIAYPYRNFLSGREPITRTSLPIGTTVNARKQVEQLRKIVSKDVQPLLTSLAGLIEVAEEAAVRGSKSTDFNKSRDAFLAQLSTLSANKDLLEKLVREGY